MSSSRFSDTDIESVRDQADLLTVVSQHVALKRTGSSYKGLCPFHDEKTASFNVNPTTGTWHCFGACQRGGDVITFVQEIEGEGFRWAVRALAEQFNVPLSYSDTQSDDGDRTARTRLIEINEAAAAFFADALCDEDAETARNFLTSRGFDVGTAVERFGCGYAPRHSAARLTTHLLSKGYAHEDIVASGVATKNDRGAVRDRFIGRLTWTIRNTFGRAVGFGARRIFDDDPLEAKFINTAETPVYKKGTLLYGYDYSRPNIAKTKQALVVEGYTDVMACHQSGVEITVATCGTAFTTDHLATLRRIVGEGGEIIFGFDDDAAGHKASLAVYDLARNSVRRLTALPPSGGLDPADLRRNQGDQAIRDLVEHRRPLIETVIRTTLDSMPLDTPEDRGAALDAALPLLGHIPDPLIRGEYGRRVAERLNFDPHEVAHRIKTPAPPPIEQPRPTNHTAANPAFGEREAIRIMVQDEASAWEFLETIAPLVNHPNAQTVVDILRRALAEVRNGRTWAMHVASKAGDQHRQLIQGLLANGLPVPSDKIPDYANDIIERLKVEATDRSMTHLHDVLRSTDDPDEKERALRTLIEASEQKDVSI